MLYRNYHVPVTIEEAVTLLASGNGSRVKPIAGGTDLMIQLREHVLSAETLVDISQIEELKHIRVDGDMLRIGAAVTYAQLKASPEVQRYAYLLAEASRVVGAIQIQNMGTIGGNIANASPAGDTLPCLYVLGAQLTLRSSQGERTVPIKDFIVGVRRTDLQPGEIITEISFKGLPPNAGSSFVKLGLRQSQAISVVDTAAILTVADGKIADVRIACGSVAPTIVFCPSAEGLLKGQSYSDERFEEAANAARQDISPIDDIRGSAAYRRYVTKTLVKEALETAWQRATQS